MLHILVNGRLSKIFFCCQFQPTLLPHIPPTLPILRCPIPLFFS